MKTFGYRCSPGIRWTVQPTGLLLVRPETGVIGSLGYPAAALWDLLGRGCGAPQVTRMVRHIGGFATETEAAAFVLETLRVWHATGLVEADGGRG